MMRPSALLLVAAMAGVAPAQTALFLDSQGNRVEVTRTESTISLNCPDCRFEGSDRIYDLPVNLRDLPLKDGAFDARQAITGGNVLYNGTIAASGLIRLKVDIPGVDAPFDLALAPFVKETARQKVKPSRIVVRLRQPSATLGKWAPFDIYLADGDGNLVAPEKETTLHLEVEGGTPMPAIVKLTPENPKVPGGIVPTTSLATLKVIGTNVDPAKAVAIGCEEKPGAPLALKMSATRERASADGRDAVPVILSLVDMNEVPATDGNPQEVAFDIAGTGRVATSTAKTVTIPAGQCAAELPIVADSAGSGKVSADFRGKHLAQTVVFRPALTLFTLLLTLGGGLIGGLASVGRNFAAAAKWKFGRWFNWFVALAIGAIALYAAYFYGLLRVAGGLPSSAVFAVLAGAIGGFLAAAIQDKLAGPAVEV